MNNLEDEVSLVNIIEISHYLSLIEGWTDDYRQTVLAEYEEFLEKSSKTPHRPSLSVDKLWHEHILNTLSYETYCLPRFGRIIHHVPCINKELVGKLSVAIGRTVAPIEGSLFLKMLTDNNFQSANCSGGSPPTPASRKSDANCGSGNPPIMSPKMAAEADCSSGGGDSPAQTFMVRNGANCGAGNTPPSLVRLFNGN